MTLSTSTKNSLDEELFEYHSVAREIALRKIEIETQRELDDNFGGGRTTVISKPVENLVMKFSSDPRIKYLEELKVNADRCFESLSEEQREIFDLRWGLGESNTWEEIAGKLNFSIKSIYRKREKILERYAIAKGKM